MDRFCFRSFVNMLTRSGGCLVEKGRANASAVFVFDDLPELKVQRFVRQVSFKASRHFLTTRADTELTIRSLRVSVRIVRMIVGLSKVRCMNKIRFAERCGTAHLVCPGGPCEQRDPSSCPLGNDLFSRSNLLVW